MTVVSTIGRRLHELRTSRTPKLTQQELAERAGVSVDVVQKLEQGQRHGARIGTLTALARALDVDLPELVGKPTKLAGLPDGGGLLELRRAVTPVAEPGPPGDVAGELVDGWAAYWAGHYDTLTGVLPGILARAGGEQHAEALELAGSVLVHLGHGDLALHAVDRAAAVAEGELLRAELAWTRAWVLLCQGRPEDGAAVAVRELDGWRVRAGDPPQRTSAWGVLLVTAASAAVRAGAGDQAREMLRAARAAAVMCGQDRWDHHTHFGEAKVTLMEAECHTVAGDYAAALDAAAGMPTGHGLPLASWARHRTDVALSHLRLGHPVEAQRVVLDVARSAPRWLRYQVFPQTIIAELLGHRPGAELRLLAARLGVDPDGPSDPSHGAW